MLVYDTTMGYQGRMGAASATVRIRFFPITLLILRHWLGQRREL